MRGGISVSRGMKPWTDRSLNRNPEPELSAIGVEKSFDPANEPGIPRVSILLRFFYTFRVLTSTPFFSWPLHSNWLRASFLASTGSWACPKACRSLQSLSKSANCLPQTLPIFIQIPGALTGNERETCCCALTNFSVQNGHLPNLS